MKYLALLLFGLLLFAACKDGTALKELKVDTEKLREENRGYQPSHPINFPHKLHAADLGLDCKYCHKANDNGGSVRIPSVHLRMNCHKSENMISK